MCSLKTVKRWLLGCVIPRHGCLLTQVKVEFTQPGDHPCLFEYTYGNRSSTPRCSTTNPASFRYFWILCWPWKWAHPKAKKYEFGSSRRSLIISLEPNCYSSHVAVCHPCNSPSSLESFSPLVYHFRIYWPTLGSACLWTSPPKGIFEPYLYLDSWES